MTQKVQVILCTSLQAKRQVRPGTPDLVPRNDQELDLTLRVQVVARIDGLNAPSRRKQHE